MRDPVQVWRASDGSIHECRGDANRAEAAIDGVRKIAEILTIQEEVLLDERTAKALARYLVHDEGGAIIAKIIRDIEEA